MRKRIAHLTSNILNPFLIGLVLIPIVSFKVTDNPSEALKWSLILTALSVLPVFLFTCYMVRHNRLDSVFANVRRQRTVIYAVATVLASVSCFVLLVLEAPPLLLALSVAGFSANIIFMGINLRWKVSLHTAVIAAAVTVLLFLFGPASTVFIALVPLVAWARIELEQHSLAQTATGTLLAPAILVGIFSLFSLI